MGRAYSMDLRERVVAAVAQEGLSRRQAAARFGVSDSTAINWLKRVATTGSVAPGQIGGHKPKKIAGPHRDWLVGRCRERDSRVERLPAKVPHGHWRTMTFLAALRHDRVEAPWLLDGPINGETFRLYVDKVLVPTLRQGDIVVMDNLGSHKSKAVRRAIRAAGARLLFLPKYSPDLNPIEQLFSKLKHWLRRAAGRTADAVCNALGPILETVTPHECSNYFTHAGYGQT
jgi:transposase/transposase-like protein